jgi:hypothetical protein
MSESERSGWQRLLDQISSPWDWAAAGLGALGGAAVSASAMGADLGTAVAAGAVTGITARKALGASTQRQRLGRRAQVLLELLRAKAPSDERLTRPAAQLEMDQDLWRRRIISDEQFLHSIEDSVGKHREFVLVPPAKPRKPQELLV